MLNIGKSGGPGLSYIKDGGEYPLYMCPECGDESLVWYSNLFFLRT